jgi:hypothetical protein
MSIYIDSFIRDHKEYFLRNKSIIESNEWDNTEDYKTTLVELSDELLSAQSIKAKDKDKKIFEIEKRIKQFLEKTYKSKKALFEQENKLTTSILGRLSDFISESSGDRHLQKTQEFIDFTVDIINTHVKKCNDYLRYNQEVITKSALTEDEIEYNDNEIVFQDDIFNKKIDIQNKLNKLNISNSTDNFTLKLFKDQKSSLLMKEPLSLKIQDVEIATSKLNITWDVFSSFEMLKNMNPKDIPKWNHKKHFFEQDQIVLQFWQEEMLKITQGVRINGYLIHPWLYWHLNIFKTPIPQPNGTEPVINPYLRDNELFFCDGLETAEAARNKGLLFYGTRRFTKSVILASYAQWKAFTKFNSVATITGGSEGDLTDLTSKIKTSMSYMPPAFKLEFIKQEWEGGDTILGLKEDASNPIPYSTIKVKNLAAGAKTASQKTAGGAPSAFVNDEIGKYDFLKSYLAAIPSFETPFGFKCLPLLAGTAGESSLSNDAMTVLTNPQKYNLISMDWDKLNSWVDPEAISWTPRNFSLFVPAQMAYKEGFVKIEKPLGEFLKIKDAEELNKNIIQVTDWVGNLDKIKAWRKEAEGDSLLLQQRTVQYPISPEECFLSNEINPFDYETAKLHKDYLLETGRWDRRRILDKDINGKITSSLSNKELVEFPFKGGNQDAPYLIIEEPDQEKSPKFYYIASGDFYKQETTTTTDSVGTISIYKFPIFGDESGKKLVASYAARPKTYREFNDNVLLLLEYYGASFFPENEDLGVFQTYLENKHLEEVYLEKHIDFNSALSYSEGDARKYGWTPKQSKRRLIAMYATYLREPVLITNEYGEKVEVKRIQTIDDIHLLTEIINYSDSGNFDRISGNIGSIGFLHFLEKNYIYPKGVKRKVNEQETQKLKQERPRQFFSQTGRNRSFFSNRR